MNCKNLILALSLVFLSFGTLLADIEIEGVYQGKNLYVQNPFTSNMKDYCTREVFVNDVKLLSEVQSSAFEVDLSAVPVNNPVTVRITHKEDCKPKILNPQVVEAKTSFSFNAINLTDRTLSWAVKGENPKGRYFIQRFEHNSWKIVGEIYSRDQERYTQELKHNAGLNKYRVKYMEDNGNITYSNVLNYESSLEPIEFYPTRVTDNLYLSRKAYYEILDKYGNIIKRGEEKEIGLSQLSTGVYYLNTDNQIHKFFKK